MELERKLVGVRVKKPRDVIQKDISEMFEDIGSRSKESLRSTYHAIGSALINYFIDGDCPFFSDLIEGFRDLGFGVAFLCDLYQDTALLEEEVCWLGTPWQDTPGKHLPDYFRSQNRTLLDKETIRDCSQVELLFLHSQYLEGKSIFLRSREGMSYGKGLEKNHVDERYRARAAAIQERVDEQVERLRENDGY